MSSNNWITFYYSSGRLCVSNVMQLYINKCAVSKCVLRKIADQLPTLKTKYKVARLSIKH